MFAQLSVNRQQAYRPFYDGHAAGKCFTPQTPRETGYYASNSDCYIEVHFGGNLSAGTPEYSDGPDSRRLGSYVSDFLYSFRFEVSGRVNSGGVGFVGPIGYGLERDEKVQGNLGNGGIWTVGQKVTNLSAYGRYADGLTTNLTGPREDSPRPDGRNIRGNAFSWHDSPGFVRFADLNNRVPLVTGRFSGDFHVYVTNGERTCSVSFRITSSLRNGVWRSNISRL